jgi:hypothetical protein
LDAKVHTVSILATISPSVVNSDRICSNSELSRTFGNLFHISPKIAHGCETATLIYLAWMILEEVTGQSIRDLMQELVFGVLNMKCAFMDKHSLDTHVNKSQ